MMGVVLVGIADVAEVEIISVVEFTPGAELVTGMVVEFTSETDVELPTAAVAESRSVSSENTVEFTINKGVDK